MSEQPGHPTADDELRGREPDDSPQRRLVDSIRAYEVDPPPPARAREADGPAER